MPVMFTSAILPFSEAGVAASVSQIIHKLKLDLIILSIRFRLLFVE